LGIIIGDDEGKACGIQGEIDMVTPGIKTTAQRCVFWWSQVSKYTQGDR